MKMLFENKELILEFNNKDKSAVLKDGEKFTVAFEVELETEPNEYDDCEYEDNIEDIIIVLRMEFPNFMNKYEANLDIKEDGSLTCGVEFTMDRPKYMTGLKNAIEFLELFFKDYKNQDYFFFSENTGLHTNIGYLGKEGELEGDYNFFKALTFLNHSFATSGMGFGSREYSGWAKDLKGPAIKDIKKFLKRLPERSGGMKYLSKEKLMKMYLERNFDDISKILSDQVEKTAAKTWSKNQGFNIDNVGDLKYIEFRYPGDRDPNLKNMTKALLYYSFIVKASADPEFKKRDYIKDLIGFFNEAMDDESNISAVKAPFLKEFNKGMDFLENTNSGFSIFSYLEAALIDSIDWQWANERTPMDLLNDTREHASNIVERIIYWGFGGLIHVLKYNTFAVYNGLSKGKVSLDSLKLNPAAVSTHFNASANMENKLISPKEFQKRLPAARIGGDLDLMPIFSYQTGRQRDLTKIMDIILNSSSALEISEKLYSPFPMKDDSPMGKMLKGYPLKGSTDSGFSKSDKEEFENAWKEDEESWEDDDYSLWEEEEEGVLAATDVNDPILSSISGWPPTEEEIQSLVDDGILVRKTPTKKDKKLSELKQYFKKYKF